MKQKVVFECEFCHRRFESKDPCQTHEKKHAIITELLNKTWDRDCIAPDRRWIA